MFKNFKMYANEAKCKHAQVWSPIGGKKARENKYLTFTAKKICISFYEERSLHQDERSVSDNLNFGGL